MSNKIIFLGYKPEETLDSTLKALSFAATGMPKSAEEAAELDLPELMAVFEVGVEGSVSLVFNYA